MEDPERLFRFEETQTMIWNEIEKPVYVYALTDVILVTFINVILIKYERNKDIQNYLRSFI